MENPRAKLYEALAQAQKVIKQPTKGKKVDFVTKKGQKIKYSYAELSDVIEAVRPMHDFGLSYMHTLEMRGENLFMCTTLMHSGGGELTSWHPLPNPIGMDPQAFGSALTYARRYSLSALMGIASEDDDDAALAQDQTPPQAHKSAPPLRVRAKEAHPNPRTYALTGLMSVPAKDDLDQALGQPEAFDDPGQYTITFGKFKGKRLNQIDTDALWSYLEYLDKQSQLQNKPITGVVKEMIDTSTAYLKTVFPSPQDDFMNQEEPSWD
jgi:hypothetical protein